MRYLILRDDDVNALTPVEYLYLLHGPLLDRGLPVNFAIIPKVYTDLTRPGGALEGFLLAKKGCEPKSLTIGTNRHLGRFLRDHSNCHVVHHGYHHSQDEFGTDPNMDEHHNRLDIVHRLDQGTALLQEAGLPKPIAFAPPYNVLSRVGLEEAARRFRVISLPDFRVSIVPGKWCCQFAWKRLRRHPHWRAGNTLLLSHPPSPITAGREAPAMIGELKDLLALQRTTVVVMRWWEFFPRQHPEEKSIRAFHEVIDWLTRQTDLKLISFQQLVEDHVPLL